MSAADRPARALTRDEARRARALVERLLDQRSWPWSRSISLQIDALILEEEQGAVSGDLRRLARA